jgi:hypothetical protein
MAKATKVLVGAAAVAGLIFGAWSLWETAADDEAESAKLLQNHIWINRLPADERDMISFFVAIDHREGRVGAVGRSSVWRQLSDVFLWKLDGERLSLYFGQEEVKWQPKAKAWRCKGEAPAGFELCLKIWDDRHTVLLYSRDEWEIDPDQDHLAVEGLPWHVAAPHPDLDRDEDELEAFAPAQALPIP